MITITEGMKTYGSQQIDIELTLESIKSICEKDRVLEKDYGQPLYERLVDIRGIVGVTYDVKYNPAVICFSVIHGFDNPLTWGRVQDAINEYLYPGSVPKLDIQRDVVEDINYSG